MTPYGCEQTCPDHPYPDPPYNPEQQYQPQPQPQPQVVHVERPERKDKGSCATAWSALLSISIQHALTPPFQLPRFLCGLLPPLLVLLLKLCTTSESVHCLTVFVRSPFVSVTGRSITKDPCGTAEDPLRCDHLTDTSLELNLRVDFRTQARSRYYVRELPPPLRGCRLVKSNICRLTPSSCDGNYHRHHQTRRRKSPTATDAPD